MNYELVQVLVDRRTGILRSGKFAECTWAEDCHPVAMTDVLRVHAWKYVKGVRETCAASPEDGGTRNIDSDTAVSRGSFRAALKAAGAVCAAVDDVVAGRVCTAAHGSVGLLDFLFNMPQKYDLITPKKSAFSPTAACMQARRAFCAVRPPGHHSGPYGMVPGRPGMAGSHGFCLLNNIAIGAAYALSTHRHAGAWSHCSGRFSLCITLTISPNSSSLCSIYPQQFSPLKTVNSVERYPPAAHTQQITEFLVSRCRNPPRSATGL